MRTLWPPSKRLIIIGAAALVVLVSFLIFQLLTIHPKLELDGQAKLPVLKPLTVSFDRSVDLSKVQVTLTPQTDFRLERQPNKLLIQPFKPWSPSTNYQLKISQVTAAWSLPMGQWNAHITTQPQALAQLTADRVPVSEQSPVSPFANLSLAFSTPMRPASVEVTWNGQKLADRNLKWSSDHRSIDLKSLPPLLPGNTYTLAVPQALTAGGDQLSAPARITFQAVPAEPTNSASEPQAKQPSPPSLVVVENAPEARPQSGLQAADMVFEYLSEYEVTRMTAVYFNPPPAAAGPVRSCRPINLYLGFAFNGFTLCSGASAGTLHFIWLPGHFLPGVMWDWEPRGIHYFENSAKAPPHHVYTSGPLASKLIREQPLPASNYMLDSSHPEQLQGNPADAPAVPSHSVQWQYDSGSQSYLRFDHGVPFTDTSSGQIKAKNVIILHVPSHDPGWVEDDNGGAHSVWYSLLGSGNAEIYSGNRMLPATWHMGKDPGQQYYDNHQPIWFSDSSGKPIRLNSGLTWIHILGDN